MNKLPGGIKAIRSIYLRGNGPSVPIYYDNTDASAEESRAKLKEIKSQTASKVNLRSTITSVRTETILEAAKSLPISDSELKSILKKSGWGKIKRIVKTAPKKVQMKKVQTKRSKK